MEAENLSSSDCVLGQEDAGTSLDAISGLYIYGVVGRVDGLEANPMVLGAREDYAPVSRPLQRRIIDVIRRFCDDSVDEIGSVVNELLDGRDVAEVHHDVFVVEFVRIAMRRRAELRGMENLFMELGREAHLMLDNIMAMVAIETYNKLMANLSS